MRASILTLLLVATPFVAGCTRSVPTVFPRASVASYGAEAAPPARLGRAISEEPPLPGEEREGWEALDHTDAAGHSGHHGHHGHEGHGHAR